MVPGAGTELRCDKGLPALEISQASTVTEDYWPPYSDQLLTGSAAPPATR